MKLGAIIRKEMMQLFFVVLSFGLMVFVSYIFVSRIVENLILTNATETLYTAEATIRSDLREAEMALYNAAITVEEMLIRGESLQQIESYLFMLSSAMFEKEDSLPGFLYYFAYLHNQLIMGIHYDVPEDFYPPERTWYAAAEAKEGNIAITSPYVDAVTEMPVITLAKNLYGPDGEGYGVIALDLDIAHISNYINSIHAYYQTYYPGTRSRTEDAYGVLFDEQFNLVVHPFDDSLNVPVSTMSPGHARTVQDLIASPDGISIQRVTNVNGERIMLITKRIFNGWYLGLARPIGSYYENIRFMAIILSILGIVFMTILSIILIRLSILKADSEEKSREKSSFLARMSHEIRTPMNSILGMAELIQRKVKSEEIQEYAGIIQQSGDSLIAIINDILDFSKIESGRLFIQSRDYGITSVVNDIINMMRPRIAEKSLDFFVSVDCAIPSMIHGDDMRLRQVLTNLLSNAVKYTHKGYVSLDIGMEPIDKRSFKLICSVKDSGIGIRPEDHKRLFSEFSRVDLEANQNIEGTGLGLVISRALCRFMGGDILVSSEHGKGSTFRAVITQVFVDDTAAAMVKEPEKKRVLFYDERPLYVKALKDVLSNLKVDFKSSSGFREFITDMQSGQFDYAFVSSKFAMDCISLLGTGNKPLQLVIMVEPGEVSVYREVISIMMPIYSITMANVLNNVSDELLSHGKKFSVSFTAPSAMALIVDDISTNLRVAKELMSPYGMVIHVCTSGSEAISLLKSNRYDIVFMDHMMPGMDGIEATTHIRNIESKDGFYRKKLPIVALTANAISGQREMFLQQGINDFLAKPIDIQKLNEILERWIPKEKRIKADPGLIEDTKEANAVSLDISGVDVSVGLRNCGSSVEVYCSILADFCKDAETRLVEIAAALDKNDAPNYTILVHALKGAARSVGAMETGEKAFWLENASQGADLSALKEKTIDLEKDVKALVANIRAAIEKGDEEGTKEYVDISSLHLKELKTALAEMDIEAVNRILLEFVGLNMDPKTRGAIYELEQQILMFEYEKAIEIIDKLF